ncbi:MAG: tetratricopeptide repeat protein [Gemmatimonadales bacterium]
MADDIRSLSAALARDPSSLRYVELAEALRRRGKLEEAVQVVNHGLSRHPDHADGHDCLARIQADRGQLDEARAAWEKTLAIAPEHGGALRGIGFLYYQRGETKKAIDALEHAVRADPGDAAARRALAQLGGAAGTAEFKRKTPADVPQLRATAATLRAAEAAERAPVFAGLEGASSDMLLLDARGLVLAGGLHGQHGEDVSELAAAALAGVSGEAGRTTEYLGTGAWSVIVAEAERSNVVLSPVGDGSLLMVRRDVSTPVGLALRVAENARGAAARWLEEQR